MTRNEELETELAGTREKCDSLTEELIESQQSLLMKNEHTKEKLK